MQLSQAIQIASQRALDTGRDWFVRVDLTIREGQFNGYADYEVTEDSEGAVYVAEPCADSALICEVSK